MPPFFTIYTEDNDRDKENKYKLFKKACLISALKYDWLHHGLQSLPPSPKRAERKGRRRPFREAGSGYKQWNTVSCVDTFSIISKFSAQNSKI